MQGRGHHVDALGRAFPPDELGPEQPSAGLVHQPHVHGARPGSTWPGCRADDVGARPRACPASASASVRPVRATSRSNTFTTAVPTTPAKCRVAARRDRARHPSGLVGGRAERDEGRRAEHAVLRARCSRPRRTRRAGSCASARRRAAPRRARSRRPPRRRPRRRAHAGAHHHDVAGPSASARVDVGSERAGRRARDVCLHQAATGVDVVGSTRASRSTTVTTHPARVQRLGGLEPDVARADDDRRRTRPASSSAPQRAGVLDRAHRERRPPVEAGQRQRPALRPRPRPRGVAEAPAVVVDDPARRGRGRRRRRAQVDRRCSRGSTSARVREEVLGPPDEPREVVGQPAQPGRGLAGALQHDDLQGRVDPAVRPRPPTSRRRLLPRTTSPRSPWRRVRTCRGRPRPGRRRTTPRLGPRGTRPGTTPPIVGSAGVWDWPDFARFPPRRGSRAQRGLTHVLDKGIVRPPRSDALLTRSPPTSWTC